MLISVLPPTFAPSCLLEVEIWESPDVLYVHDAMVTVCVFFNPTPKKNYPPPPTIYPPQIMSPPWLNGRFAKICPPFSQIQANETRRNSGYIFNTAAQPFTRTMQ